MKRWLMLTVVMCAAMAAFGQRTAVADEDEPAFASPVAVVAEDACRDGACAGRQVGVARRPALRWLSERRPTRRLVHGVGRIVIQLCPGR